jgi:hypothetical protein
MFYQLIILNGKSGFSHGQQQAALVFKIKALSILFVLNTSVITVQAMLRDITLLGII